LDGPNSDYSDGKHIKYMNKLADILFKKEKDTNDEKNRILNEITKDLSLLKIIANLNEYEQTETKTIYKILKTLINSCTSLTIQNFLYDNIQEIIEALMESLNKIKNDHVVVTVLKLIRVVLKNSVLYEKILTFQFFSELYFYTKSEKFIVSFETFKLIFALIEDKKICQLVFEKFLSENKQDFCNLINSTINFDSKRTQDNYFVKRDTLKLIMSLINNDCGFFEEFRTFYLSKTENLKLIMSLLNHQCIRIKFKAVHILYHFFDDLERRETCIKTLLLANKNNFELYFNKLPENSTDSDITEKKTCILYELERLQNIC